MLFNASRLSRLMFMAASYSSFLTTQYYSPVFNTALFDGPFRIYFSQSYESVALKIYHLLQSQDLDLWTRYKKWSEETKKHAFVLIYPTQQDVEIAFDHIARSQENASTCLKSSQWEDGFILGFSNPKLDEDFFISYKSLLSELESFLSHEEKQSATLS